VLSVMMAIGFFSWSPLASGWAQEHDHHIAAREAIALIPPDAPISVWNRYLPHVTHRTIVYQFPNPWERLNYSVPGLPLPDPKGVEWVLTRDGEFQHVTDRLLASGEWVVVFDKDPVLLLRRAEA
jgi:hypothetical protein